jgi:hypothetical protein
MQGTRRREFGFVTGGSIMIVKAMSFAAIVFFGSVYLAEAQSYVNTGAPGPQTTVGWNFGNVSQCLVYDDGSNTWFVVYAVQGGYGITNNPSLAAIVAPGCQTGNLFAVHVLNLNPLVWDLLVLYPFR